MLHTLYSALRPDIAGDLAEMLGAENACSFQSLARYLSTDSHYLLQEARCREPSREEDSDTIVSFAVYCG